MMAGQTFDFASHLHHQTLVDWEIEELVGGVSNHTARIRPRRSSNDKNGSGSYYDVLKPHKSVVLKQAPAYLAKAPDIPFSPYRQTIEAAALRLLHQSVGEHAFGLREVLVKNPNIEVPKILLEDNTHNIIIQSDLGDHPSLYEVLVSPDTTLSLASELGKTLGHFLANLHDAFYFSRDSLAVKMFMNDDAERVMQSIIGLATRYMRDAGVPEYEALGQLALDHWNTRDKTAFGQGDIWFGTLLVDLHSARPSNMDVDSATNATIGICDWEFAGPNHPAADIAQLGSYLHLLSMSLLTSPRSKEVLMGFSASLYETYFSTTLVPISRAYQRALVIMHGWEMINAAGWSSRQHMWCSCTGDGVRCSHISEMVNEGAGLLRAAASDDSIDIQALKDISWSKFFPVTSSESESST